MRRQLHVLLVEDCTDDAALLLRQLRGGDWDLFHERIETAEGMTAALDAREWDLVISDFSLPRFNGLAALAMVKQHRLDAPFILVSGAVGEDIAVAAMKAGACDFILKGQWARLLPAVDRELRDAEVRKAHRRAEAQLVASEERLRMALEASNQGTWDWNLLTSEMTWSPMVESMHGLAPGAFAGTVDAFLQLIHPEDCASYFSETARAISEGRSYNTEFRVVWPDGSVHWIAGSGQVARDSEGNSVRVVGTFMDVTARQQALIEKEAAEAALEEHRVRIERANRELERNNLRLADLYSTAQRFMDNVSHEFRTPLTVIKGYAEVMVEGVAGPVSGQQAEFLGFIVDRTRELAQMVEDLLDSSKLRAGTLRVDRRPASVHDIVAKVRPILMRMATAKNVRIAERLDEGLPEVFADAEKAGRVIINLVVNAVKFSPEASEVTIWARHAGGGVEIGVSDHGPGIAAEDLGLIFQRFKQVGNTPIKNTDGIGLGLNIAEELVALNLGDIQVVSELGKGSTFSFTLPPNDPPEVLRRYLDYLAVAASLSTLAAIRVSCHLPDGISSEMRGFIASAINPLDLVLGFPDGCSLLIVGASADSKRFTERLRAAMESVCGRYGGPGCMEALQVEHLGAWHYPAEEQKAVERILQELSQEVLHV